MREETEWVETVNMGWNKVVGASESKIIDAYNFFSNFPPKANNKKPYGLGNSAEKIVSHILKNFKDN